MKALRFVPLLVLAACAHGGAEPPVMAPEGQSAIVQPRSVADLTPTPAPKPFSYVANTTANTIGKFAETENGNEAPVATLGGTTTKLSSPTAVALDASGKIYAPNGNNTITVYPAGASGNMAPLKTISCGGLNHPSALALDASGNLYVANRSGNSVSIFSSSAVNCVSGNRIIVGTNTGLAAPNGILEASGKIFVANQSGNSVTEYAAGASGDASPVAKIFGSLTKLHFPAGITVDVQAHLFVANNTGITVYSAGAVNDAAPLRTIAGASTLITDALNVGVSITGRTFVTDKSNAVLVFAANANGNVAPSQRVIGTMTELSMPEGLNLFEPLQTVGIRLSGEASFTDPTYGFVLAYFDGLTSTTSQIVHVTAGDRVVFKNVDSSLPHTLSFLNDATTTTANFPAGFDGSSTASIAGTSIGATHFSTGALNPNQQSTIYYAAPGLFTVGCAFHYDSSHMRTVIVSK